MTYFETRDMFDFEMTAQQIYPLRSQSCQTKEAVKVKTKKKNPIHLVPFALNLITIEQIGWIWLTPLVCRRRIFLHVQLWREEKKMTICFMEEVVCLDYL